MKNANACYTGGGIYIIQAELDDGTFFVVDSEGLYDIYKEDYMKALENDEDMSEFIVRAINSNLSDNEVQSLKREAIEWIITNEPKGNYLVSDLQRLI